jgi:hypothetical protein
MSTGSIASSNDSQHSGQTADENPVNTVVLLGQPAMQNALPENHGTAGLQSDNDVRVNVTSKRWERQIGIRVFCRFPGAPAVSPSRRTVQASYLHRLRDGTGIYSDAWLNFKSLGGKTPAGKHALDCKESAVNVVFFLETNTTSKSYIGPLIVQNIVAR